MELLCSLILVNFEGGACVDETGLSTLGDLVLILGATGLEVDEVVVVRTI